MAFRFWHGYSHFMAGKKKTKQIIILAIIGHISLTLLAIAVFLLFLRSPWWKPILTSYYSNNENYIQSEGQISKVSDNIEENRFYISFEWIINEEGEIVNGRNITISSEVVYVYAPTHKIKELYDTLKNRINYVICFTYSKPNSKASFDTPIVQISMDNTEILSFNEGKTELLNYISKYW